VKARTASGPTSSAEDRRHPVVLRAAPEREKLLAIEAELVEVRERADALEARIRSIEDRLEPKAAGASGLRPPGEAELRPGPVRSIDSMRWDEVAERAYWLRRCEGFRVSDSSGVLGIVDSIRFGRELDRPETLIVAAGRRWRRRHVEIDVSELAEISPEEQRISLAVPARDWLLPSARHALPRLGLRGDRLGLDAGRLRPRQAGRP
jgi:hypothetical protein